MHLTKSPLTHSPTFCCPTISLVPEYLLYASVLTISFHNAVPWLQNLHLLLTLLFFTRVCIISYGSRNIFFSPNKMTHNMPCLTSNLFNPIWRSTAYLLIQIHFSMLG